MNNKRRDFLLSMLISGFSMAAFAQTGEVDIRKRCEMGADGQDAIYVLTFVARSGPRMGHAYVEWAAEDSVLRACISQGFGLVPQSSEGRDSLPIVLLRSVPGAVHVENERDETGELLKLFVRVDSRQYRATLDYARALNASASQTYRLLDNDCVEFIRSVAAQLNLNVPKRGVLTLTPRRYMIAFIKQNLPRVKGRP